MNDSVDQIDDRTEILLIKILLRGNAKCFELGNLYNDNNRLRQSSNPKALRHADKQDICVKKKFRINFQKSCSGFEELLRPRGLTQHASAATADLVGLI